MKKRIKTAAAILILSIGVLLWYLVEYVGNEEEYSINYNEIE
jgi:hypothetical protein